MSEDGQLRALRSLSEDRWLAHATLFPHRHPAQSPPAHRDLVRHIYAPGARMLIEGFRGFAKSTYLEEAAIVRGSFREFHNMVVVGSSYRRACDRLASIRREFEINEFIEHIFGKMVGNTWQEGKIVLANGACIQALGRDQSMLGMKHLDWRPDAALIDDVEDADESRTDVERQQTWDWFLKTFLPSLDHPLYSWVRVLAARRGSGSLPERLEKEGWPTAKFPIEYIDSDGKRQATWPAKFPLAVIDQMKDAYRGDMDTYMQEYMCEATSAADRVFRRDMIKVEPRVPSWHAVYAMIDPARTRGAKSATTGWAVWSWISNRLVVWAAGAAMLLPDEIVDLAFTIGDGWNPVEIGFEKDGLEEWGMQPIRHEQVKRGIMLPIRGIRAPRDKRGFIRGLQPFYVAGEVIHAAEFPELVDQLLSFPYGKIDAPNALAYALQMRPQAPIFENFSADHIAPVVEIAASQPLYLAANAAEGITTAALCQYFDGRLSIIADWVIEGPPADCVAEIQASAALEGDTTRLVESRVGRDLREALKLPAARMRFERMRVRWVVPPSHRDRWHNVGLLQSIGRIPATASCGAMESAGREHLRGLLGRNSRGLPAVRVSEESQWVLRAFTGGYTRALTRAGTLGAEAEAGPYRTLMEGIESFVGMMAVAPVEDDDENANWSYNKAGQRYRSALPARG